MADKIPAPPAHLSTASKKKWKDVLLEFPLESRFLGILEGALTHEDVAAEANAAMRSAGIFTEGRYGLKTSPAVAVHRAATLAAAKLWRELGVEVGLEDEAPRLPTRFRS